jgi:ADP-heptose:LPS heptosyltransferase
LKQFAALASIPGVRLFALQKFEGREQLADVAASLGVHDLGAQLDVEGGSFMDTAAVMRNLDLVITSDTATAHLAGALGVRVWTLLSSAPDWRWFLDRDDSPWYPSMRLFRQTTAGDWAGVFERVAEQLRQLTL